MSEPTLERIHHNAFLSLGSNMGDRAGYLRSALNALADADDMAQINLVLEVVKVSRFYESSPVGGPEQPNYLNAVVELRTTATARELLEVARHLEGRAARRRTQRWGPRTLDVDVLLVGSEKVNEPDLVVPHPRMWERAFVVEPLMEIAAEQLSPITQSCIAGEVWPWEPSPEEVGQASESQTCQ